MNAALKAELEGASQGLLYLSEGEAPFEYVELAGATVADLAPARFGALVGALVGAPAGALVEEQSLDRFLGGQIEGADPADPVGQAQTGAFASLRALLQARLAGVRVLRVGAVEIRCYLVGVSDDGVVAGLATTAFES